MESSRKSSKFWTSKEIRFLRNSVDELTIRQIAEELNRSYPSVCNKAQKLKLKFSRISKRDIRFANTFVPYYGYLYIAKQLNKTPDTIRNYTKGIKILNNGTRGHRKCTVCKQMLSLSRFYKHPNCKYGHNPSCKNCVKIRKRANPEAQYKANARYLTKRYMLEACRVILQTDKGVRLIKEMMNEKSI